MAVTSGQLPLLTAPERSWPDWYVPAKDRRDGNRLVAAGLHPLGAVLGPDASRCGACKHELVEGHEERVREVMEILDGRPMTCLGRTQRGHPRHPSRLALNTPLEAYREPTRQGAP